MALTPSVRPRIRVIIDNDFSGDPDGLVQLAHHLLSPSVEIRGVIGSHLRPGDPFDPSDATARNAAAAATEVAASLGLADEVTIVAGSDTGMPDTSTPVASAAVDLIVSEAMREDAELPLFVVCGAGLTEIASAWLREPRIAERLTVVWIGGEEYPGLAVPPPGASAVEYNLAIDVEAARVVFNDSDLPLWHIPRDAYRQALMSASEFDERVAPMGEVGRVLDDAIGRVFEMTSTHGFSIGETYVMGDSPLVLVTALQSSFEPDASSSASVTRPAPAIGADGRADFTAPGREVRVFTRLDTRLMFDDLYAKLASLERRH